MQNRTLYFGDNLEILRKKIKDESFDLIYLDPPFNSNRNYNVLFKEGIQDSPAQIKAFDDSWHWTRESKEAFDYLVTKTNEDISSLMQALEKMVGHNDMLAYLTMMTVRLIELHRVLKKTGSLYLHCDPTASHYLKIVLDAIFWKKNFRNEIIWCYRGAGYPKKDFGKRHDIIFRYSKTDNYIFNLDDVREEYAEATKERFKYHIGNIRKGKDFGAQELNPLGKQPDDWWQIQPLAPSSKERLGYPTQKPEALLERIIKASSKEGDWILDPFCGCGTTVAVSEKLKRNWVGIDVTSLAINLIKYRIKNQFGLGNKQIFVDGLPTDLAGAKELFEKDPFEFEYWASDLVNAIPPHGKSKDNMRGADKGVDGVINILRNIVNGNKEYGKIIVQIKGGKVQRNQIATLKGDVDREKAEAGVFITLEKPTKPMKSEAVDAGTFTIPITNKVEFPKIQILTIEELLRGKKPDLPRYGLVKNYYKEAKASEMGGGGLVREGLGL
ncbi:MAG: restriction endonuclease [Candidatus Pacebacteria bacterium]|nr:restriction endonuclease [Candidatus Paceibacterota bacterium]